MERRKAPDPDGVPGLILIAVARELSGDIEHMFTDCLRSGQFPSAWKEARFVLHKKDKSIEDPSVYKPICLLDEAKLLERIIDASSGTFHG